MNHNLKNNFIFTSEAVSEAHPDKFCDQIADKILTFCLKKDPNAHVACEVFATDSKLIIGGEFCLNFKLQKKTIKHLVFKVIKDIKIKVKFKIMIFIQSQSIEIKNAVDFDKTKKNIGAGDQGIMFGYAIKNNFNYMPPTLLVANEALFLASKLRKEKKVPFLLADMKSQVTMEFNYLKQPIAIKKFLLSIQHPKNYDQNIIKNYVIKNIIDVIAKKYNFDSNFEKIINPTKDFSIGGTSADSGLTGRKIVVDNYGGFAPCGGGSFSGKDYTKVDRSIAYMCRYVAKNLVAANICKEILIQVSYIIGQNKPSSYFVNTFNSSQYSNKVIVEFLKKNLIFDFNLSSVIKNLNLKKTNYYLSSIYNPFCNLKSKDFSWEQTNKVALIKNYFKNESFKNEK